MKVELLRCLRKLRDVLDNLEQKVETDADPAVMAADFQLLLRMSLKLYQERDEL